MPDEHFLQSLTEKVSLSELEEHSHSDCQNFKNSWKKSLKVIHLSGGESIHLLPLCTRSGNQTFKKKEPFCKVNW